MITAILNNPATVGTVTARDLGAWAICYEGSLVENKQILSGRIAVEVDDDATEEDIGKALIQRLTLPGE